MIDTVLRLHLLNEAMAIFMGDSEETEEIETPWGTQEHKMRFPCFQISREDWELHGRPVVIHIAVTDAALAN